MSLGCGCACMAAIRSVRKIMSCSTLMRALPVWLNVPSVTKRLSCCFFCIKGNIVSPLLRRLPAQYGRRAPCSPAQPKTDWLHSVHCLLLLFYPAKFARQPGRRVLSFRQCIFNNRTFGLMSAPQFDIIFRGDIVFGHQLAEVKLKLQQLFKADAAKIDSLFSGRPVPLKRNMDEATAQKYRDALIKAGAMVEICPSDKSPANAPAKPLPVREPRAVAEAKKLEWTLAPV